MNNRTLNLTLISPSKILTHPSIFNKHNHVYTVVSILEPSGKVQKFKTTWNNHMKFMVNEAALLVVKIKASRLVFGKKLGEVSVPVKELMEGVTSEGKTGRTVSYPVKGWSGESMGDLMFCYEFGKLVSGEAKKKTGNVAVGGGTSSQSDSGFWFGNGFLGGMLPDDVANNIGGGGSTGGGGSGGGCGGGCCDGGDGCGCC